jgi:hypothetical protein
MNVVLSLDYEVFFGRGSGRVTETVLEPSDALARLAQRHGARLVFFVDACWLVRMREEARRVTALAADLYRVLRQLERFAAAGHELQLHLHPHWRDAHWAGDGWRLDLSRFRLHDFAPADIHDIVHEGATVLRSLAGRQPVTAFRAGGWSIQPFPTLRPALRAAGILIDSTVFAGGLQTDGTQRYDFRRAPRRSFWRFENDPLVPDPEGGFLEVPIASQSLGPLFFWQLALARRLGLRAHRPLGGGEAAPMPRRELARRLLGSTVSVASIDGLKCRRLEAAYQRHWQSGAGDFVAIGHPKATTPDSLRQLERFFAGHRHDHFVGLNDYLVHLGDRPRQARAMAPLIIEPLRA